VSKDPYHFEFLDPSGRIAERDLEQRLTDRIVETLRGPGPGFAFVGRRVHLEIGRVPQRRYTPGVHRR